ncbi:MAG: nucleotide exchange factor GrpE [Anaerolineales bacterium]
MAKRKKASDNKGKQTEQEQTPTLKTPSPTGEESQSPNAEAKVEAPPAEADETGAESEPAIQEISLRELKDELAAAQAQAAENLEGWQRALAEFANYKKRIGREQEGAYQRAAAIVIARILGVLDDLELALEDRPKEDASGWADGIEMIHRKLRTILENEGVEPIPALGETFDPNLHDAVSLEESDEHSENQIIGVVQQGYRMGDRILRPAKVRVAK